MEFEWSPELQVFHKEVRAFIKSVLPPDWGGFGEDGDWEFVQQARKKLAQKQWLVMHWPKEYGGQGASHWQMVTYAEEMTYFRYPGIYSIGHSHGRSFHHGVWDRRAKEALVAGHRQRRPGHAPDVHGAGSWVRLGCTSDSGGLRWRRLRD